MHEEQKSARGRKVQRTGMYSGIRPDGQPWPEVLLGAEEIGGYLRIHPVTVRRMIRDGRLPAEKDSRKRWMTTKSILEKWMLQGMKLQKLQREERQWAANLMSEEVAPKLKPRLVTGPGREIACEHCKGWGKTYLKIGTEPQPCPHCEGGYRRAQGSANMPRNHASQLKPERRG